MLAFAAGIVGSLRLVPWPRLLPADSLKRWTRLDASIVARPGIVCPSVLPTCDLHLRTGVQATLCGCRTLVGVPHTGKSGVGGGAGYTTKSLNPTPSDRRSE